MSKNIKNQEWKKRLAFAKKIGVQIANIKDIDEEVGNSKKIVTPQELERLYQEDIKRQKIEPAHNFIANAKTSKSSKSLEIKGSLEDYKDFILKLSHELKATEQAINSNKSLSGHLSYSTNSLENLPIAVQKTNDILAKLSTKASLTDKAEKHLKQDIKDLIKFMSQDPFLAGKLHEQITKDDISINNKKKVAFQASKAKSKAQVNPQELQHSYQAELKNKKSKPAHNFIKNLKASKSKDTPRITANIEDYRNFLARLTIELEATKNAIEAKPSLKGYLNAASGNSSIEQLNAANKYALELLEDLLNKEVANTGKKSQIHRQDDGRVMEGYESELASRVRSLINFMAKDPFLAGKLHEQITKDGVSLEANKHIVLNSNDISLDDKQAIKQLLNKVKSAHAEKRPSKLVERAKLIEGNLAGYTARKLHADLQEFNREFNNQDQRELLFKGINGSKPLLEQIAISHLPQAKELFQSITDNLSLEAKIKMVEDQSSLIDKLIKCSNPVAVSWLLESLPEWDRKSRLLDYNRFYELTRQPQAGEAVYHCLKAINSEAERIKILNTKPHDNGKTMLQSLIDSPDSTVIGSALKSISSEKEREKLITTIVKVTRNQEIGSPIEMLAHQAKGKAISYTLQAFSKSKQKEFLLEPIRKGGRSILSTLANKGDGKAIADSLSHFKPAAQAKFLTHKSNNKLLSYSPLQALAYDGNGKAISDAISNLPIELQEELLTRREGIFRKKPSLIQILDKSEEGMEAIISLIKRFPEKKQQAILYKQLGKEVAEEYFSKMNPEISKEQVTSNKEEKRQSIENIESRRSSISSDISLPEIPSTPKEDFNLHSTKELNKDNMDLVIGALLAGKASNKSIENHKEVSQSNESLSDISSTTKTRSRSNSTNSVGSKTISPTKEQDVSIKMEDNKQSRNSLTQFLDPIRGMFKKNQDSIGKPSGRPRSISHNHNSKPTRSK